MSKEFCCPLCGSKEVIRRDVSANENYFLFEIEDKWVCKNCGCLFSETEEYTEAMEVTKISKKEFFEIIFDAISEICGTEYLTKEKQKEIIHFYKKNIKTYYKEVAELQASIFYETDCRYKESWIVNMVRGNQTKYFISE